MFWRPVVFLLVLAGCCTYAARRGGQPERVAAAAMALAAIATAFIPTDPRVSFRSVEWVELEIDVLLLVVLTLVACAADRFWPLWAAAMHLDTIAVHAVRAIDPLLVPSVYEASTGWAAYPILGALVIGTARHQRRMLYGGDAEWSYHRG